VRLSPSEVPLALYVHVPWCVRKCPYCDFNSHPARGPVDGEAYAHALLADLDLDLPLAGGRPLLSIFIGGGTPSLLSPATVRRLLDGIRSRLPLAAGAEVTLEANPGSSDASRFSGYRDAGVTRLSIGAQSFDPAALRALGRVHGPEEIHRAVDAARRAGFESLNLDLMFGLPGQTPARGLADVGAAIALEPDHISYYQLTIEPNTAFARLPPALPDEDAASVVQEQGQALMEGAGYARYEVSAFARPGHRSRHNLNYWEFGDYLGIGAGAHGKLTLPGGEVERRWRLRDPRRYLGAAGTTGALAGARRLDDADLVAEFALNALRLEAGFPRGLFEARTGLGLERLASPIQAAEARGLIEASGESLRPTALGCRFLNDLIGHFLSPPDARCG
jgi:oxygen-independent coproporphyrinogen-3 oxidase